LTTSRINLLKSATADKTACRPKVPHGGSVGRNSADGARGDDDDVDAVDAVDVRASPSSSLTRGIVFRSSNQRTEVNDYDDDDDDDASTDGRSNGRTRERHRGEHHRSSRRAGGGRVRTRPSAFGG